MFAAASPAAPAKARQNIPKVQLKEKSATVFPRADCHAGRSKPGRPQAADCRSGRNALGAGGPRRRCGWRNPRSLRPTAAASRRSRQPSAALLSSRRSRPPTPSMASCSASPAGASTRSTIVVDRQEKRGVCRRDGPRGDCQVGPERPQRSARVLRVHGQPAPRPWGDLADPLQQDAPRGKIQEDWRQKSGLPTTTMRSRRWEVAAPGRLRKSWPKARSSSSACGPAARP